MKTYRGAEKLWDINVTVMPIVDGALGTIPNSLEKNTGQIGEPLCHILPIAAMLDKYILGVSRVYSRLMVYMH